MINYTSLNQELLFIKRHPLIQVTLENTKSTQKTHPEHVKKSTENKMPVFWEGKKPEKTPHEGQYPNSQESICQVLSVINQSLSIQRRNHYKRQQLLKFVSNVEC